MTNLDVLIERWRAGDQRAAENIYDLHKERTYRLAYALLGNAQDAEEAAQDALAYALLHIHQFDARRSLFSTWLHMITVSRSRDILRKRRLPVFSLTSLFQPRHQNPGTTQELEQHAVRAEARDAVWQAIDELNPMLREAIVLRHWGGHTYQEIAEITGCPLKTAQSRVRLAHQKLSQRLAQADISQAMEETS